MPVIVIRGTNNYCFLYKSSFSQFHFDYKFSEMQPKKSISVCTCLEADLNSTQPSKSNPSSIVTMQSAHVNTSEPEKETKSNAQIDNLNFSQSNSKLHEHINSFYIEKNVKSITKPIPELLDIIKHSQRVSNDSSLSTEKEMTTITPGNETDAYSKRSTNTNSVLNVRKETRSIEQNKDIFKKSINISAINIERVTKCTEQSTGNLNMCSKKSVDVNTQLHQETKSVAQSKAHFNRITSDDKLTNTSAQFSNSHANKG